MKAARCSGKGDKERIVPLGRPAMEALETYLGGGRDQLSRQSRPLPWLFLSERGEQLSRQWIWRIVKSSDCNRKPS